MSLGLSCICIQWKLEKFEHVQVGSPAGKLCDVISPMLHKTSQALELEMALFWCKRESDVEKE